MDLPEKKDGLNQVLDEDDSLDDSFSDEEAITPKTVGLPCPSQLQHFLTSAISQEASDLHMADGYPPTIRANGRITPLDQNAAMTSEEIVDIFRSITTKEQRVTFQRDCELDFFYEVPGLARMRTNACRQQGSLSMSFRIIPTEIPSMEQLGLPSICKKLSLESNGLLLVTGPTGVGKTTTMAAMINYICQKYSRKIVTIEDPIEYVYGHGQSFVIQRNLGSDTRSFAEGLKRALRQDPDVILIGEMRDLETIAAALTAAETGHLVIATLHTLGAAPTIDRIVDVFPSGQAPQIRLQMSLSLRAVVSQTLLPRADSRGRVAAFEVMVGTTAIRNLIRDGKTHQIDSTIETGSMYGMFTLAQDIRRLANEGVVRADVAESVLSKPAA
jgi:twitching motility protein PilT